MKKLIMICIAVLFLLACAERPKNWKIETIIKAEITMLEDNKLSLVYHLGPVLIVDTIRISDGWYNYINSQKSVRIKLVASNKADFSCSNGTFKYYIEENFINKQWQCAPIELPSIEKHANK